MLASAAASETSLRRIFEARHEDTISVLLFLSRPLTPAPPQLQTIPFSAREQRGDNDAYNCGVQRFMVFLSSLYLGKLELMKIPSFEKREKDA